MKKDHPPPPIEFDQDELNARFDLVYKTSRSDLDKIDHDVLRWCCAFKGCKRTTGVRDYGVAPHYFATNLKGGAQWISIPNQIMLCRKHSKFIDRLVDQYGPDHTYRRCLKPDDVLFQLTSKKTSK